MVKKCFAFVIFILASAWYFDLANHYPKYVFINSPFDEQRAYYREFFKWKDEFYGRFDVAFLRYGRIIRA